MVNTGYIPDEDSFVSTDLLLRIYLRIKRKSLSRWRFQNVTTTKAGSYKGRLDNGYMITDEQDELWKNVYNIMKTMRSVWLTSRILNGLPEEVGELEDIMENGGSSQQHYNRSIRELSWLEENGMFYHEFHTIEIDVFIANVRKVSLALNCFYA